MTEGRQKSILNGVGFVGGLLGLVAAFVVLGTSFIDRDTANLNQQSLEDLQGRLETVESESNNVQVRIEDVAGDVEVAVGQIDEVEEASSSLDERLDVVEEVSEGLQTSLQGLVDGGSQPTAQTSDILVGTWDGQYRCNLGLTGFTLTIESTSESSLLALFELYPTPANTRIQSGSFVMSGTVSRQAVELDPDYWIVNPGGYVMISLSADLPSGNPPVLEGVVTGPGCERFELVKTSDDGKEIPL